MKNIYASLLLLLISSCSSIPTPSILTPEENRTSRNTDFGKYPDNYQIILKEYLMTKVSNHKESKVEFINKPQKISIDHLGGTYTGYRVCLSINEKVDEFYKGFRNHLILIKNDNIELHLYDSGLLAIPFEYCVTRNENRTMFIDDIKSSDKTEDNSETIENMDKIQPIVKQELNSDRTYILCKFNNEETTYIFSETDNIFYKDIDTVRIDYNFKFSEAFIVAENENEIIKINRVTGIITKNDNNGMCDLLNKTKF